MGRELRRVPARWEHPKVERYGRLNYQPLFESNFAEEAKEWDEGNALWSKGEHPDQIDGSADNCKHFEDWYGERPNPNYYVPYDCDNKELCTWYQIYENVSEGTPVTPAFEKPEDLIEYLVTKGDFWQQSDQREGKNSFRGKNYSRAAANNMVLGSGYAPSFVMDSGRIIDGPEAMVELKATM